MNDPTAATDPIGFAALPEPLRARIDAELAPGERLLWAAPAASKPEAALLSPIKPGMIGLIALGVGLILFWIGIERIGLRRPGDPGLPSAFGLLAVIVSLIAFAVTLGAWVQRRQNRRPDRRQLYALTDRRLVIWKPEDRAGGVEVFTIAPSLVRAVHRLEYSDGSGEVRIDFVGETSDAGPWFPKNLICGTNVRRVESLIRAVLTGPTINARSDRAAKSAQDEPFFDPNESEEPF